MDCLCSGVYSTTINRLRCQFFYPNLYYAQRRSPLPSQGNGKTFFSANKVRKQCTISIKSRPRMGSSRRTDSLTLNLMIQSLSSNSQKNEKKFWRNFWKFHLKMVKIFFQEIFRIVRGWVFPQNRILKFGSTPKFGWERGQFFNTPLRAPWLHNCRPTV